MKILEYLFIVSMISLTLAVKSQEFGMWFWMFTACLTTAIAMLCASVLYGRKPVNLFRQNLSLKKRFHPVQQDD